MDREEERKQNWEVFVLGTKMYKSVEKLQSGSRQIQRQT